MPHGLFISHSDKDRVLADSLLEVLERRGVNCWIAPRDIPPGGSYAESIINAVEQATGFVLVFTKHSSVSPHVLREVEQALRFRKNIMPIRFDDTPVSKALDYLLSTVHWLSATPKAEALDKAAAQIAAALAPSKGTAQVPAEKPIPALVVAQRPRSKRPLFWATIIAIALIAAITFLRFLRTESSPTGTSGGENILAADNGGQILVAPNATWTGTTDGKEEEVYWFSPNDEGVYGFNGAAPARFGRFAVLIPDSNSHNLRQFELLAGDDSPIGHFRSIGKFTTKNARLSANDGYQEFSFPPVTAKYLKVKLLSPHDPDDKRILLYEFRLFGEPASPVTTSATPPPSSGTSLLSPDNGGAVASSPNDNWKQTIDDREDQVYWFEPREEAVYRFKNEQAVTFDRFSVLIPDNDEHNLKEFELLAGSDSPTGEFRSIGKFKTYNARVGPDGYQDFSFPAVTAKYLKVRLLAPHSTNDPRIYLYEFRLFGVAK